MQLLESSINILDTGVNDYTRLTKVLQTTRVRLQIKIPSCTTHFSQFHSISNSSPNPLSKPPNKPSSRPSNPNSTPYSRASKHTSTKCLAGNKGYSPKQNCKKAVSQTLRNLADKVRLRDRARLVLALVLLPQES